MDKISIITPVYNDSVWLINVLLPSIERQTIGLKQLEVIVVDDGSDDKDYIKHIPSWVRLIETEHKGASVARNIGIKSSTGNYLFFPDADCFLYYDCLELLYRNLIGRQKVFSYCHFFIVDLEGWMYFFKSYKFNFELLKKINFVSSCTLVPKTEDVFWDEELKRFQDWELWLRLAKKGYMGLLVNNALFLHFVRKNSITNSTLSYKEARDKVMSKI